MADELAHHGYEISPGTLYPLLHRMEGDDMLTSSTRVVAGRARRSYRATESGRRMLAELRPTLAEAADEILPARSMTARPVGHVSSLLTDLGSAPRQGDEGAPDAWIVLVPEVANAAADIRVGDDLVILTWLDQADRDTLTVQPRGDGTRKQTGVFSTRSPDRPNPIGLHQTRVLTTTPSSIEVSGLEAVDGTPVVDIKISLGALGDR